MLAKKENSNIVKLDPQTVLIENTKPALFKSIKDLPAVIASNHESLAAIKKTYGENLPLAIIKVWLVNLNDFLNISRKMNEVQITETAELIFDEFHYLKTSDLALIFQRIKTGFYGQFYESIDGMKIMDMFFKYGQERLNKFIDITEKEQKNYKEFKQIDL
jgi:hypothetical protein